MPVQRKDVDTESALFGLGRVLSWCPPPPQQLTTVTGCPTSAARPHGEPSARVRPGYGTYESAAASAAAGPGRWVAAPLQRPPVVIDTRRTHKDCPVDPERVPKLR